MSRVYFDMRDGSQIAPDEEGDDLSCIEAVKREAAEALAEMARDNVRRSCPKTNERRELTVVAETIMG
jgi:hypothetical protein